MENGSWGNNFLNGSPGLRDKPDGTIFEKWGRTNDSYLLFCSEGKACVFCKRASLLRTINLRGELPPNDILIALKKCATSL